MFNDTSRYLDNIFNIDNSEFEKHISDIYPAAIQLNKANTQDKDTSFLDLNIKVIGSDTHTSVCDKRNDFGFPIVYFPWSHYLNGVRLKASFLDGHGSFALNETESKA